MEWSRRVFKVSLRELFLLITVLGLVVGWSLDHCASARRQSRLHSIERCYYLMAEILKNEGYEVIDKGDESDREIIRVR